MPTIEITDEDFARLQKLATPFIDTPATTLSRVLDHFEADGSSKPASPDPLYPTYTEQRLPPLTHTRILDARLGDLTPERATWDALVRLSLICTLKQVGSVRELRTASGANVAQGKKETDGYRFVPGHQFSYQGVSAEDAVQIITRCAKVLGETVLVEFEWRNKEGAYRPGERARLTLGVAGSRTSS